MDCDRKREECRKTLKELFFEKFKAQDALRLADQANYQAGFKDLMQAFKLLKEELWQRGELKDFIEERLSMRLKDRGKVSWVVVLGIICSLIGAAFSFHLYMTKITERIVITERTDKEILEKIKEINKKLEK